MTSLTTILYLATRPAHGLRSGYLTGAANRGVKRCSSHCISQ